MNLAATPPQRAIIQIKNIYMELWPLYLTQSTSLTITKDMNSNIQSANRTQKQQECIHSNSSSAACTEVTPSHTPKCIKQHKSQKISFEKILLHCSRKTDEYINICVLHAQIGQNNNLNDSSFLRNTRHLLLVHVKWQRASKNVTDVIHFTNIPPDWSDGCFTSVVSS